MAEDCERTLLRRELIRELFEEDRSISELSQRYGLSRKSIHSWKRRYEQEGLKGLEPKSHRPHRSPREAISREWKEEVLELKRRRRRWGAKKLVAELKRRHPDKAVVSERTIGRLLRAAALTADRRRRSRKNGPLVELPNRPVASASNLVWAMDFKDTEEANQPTHTHRRQERRGQNRDGKRLHLGPIKGWDAFHRF